MRKLLTKLLPLILCVVIIVSFCACDNKQNEIDFGTTGTLEEVGYQTETKTMTKFYKLEDIYFPNGMLDTKLGTYIYKDGEYYRTDINHDKIDPNRKMLIYIHGMGGNRDFPRAEDFYNQGYNVIVFEWGTFASETMYTEIANKIVYRGYGRWSPDNGDSWIEDDICNVTITEIFGAFYYDIMTAYPNYKGTEVKLVSFSYGGMLLGSVNSYLTTAFTNGFIPSYVLPDIVTMLDPFMCRMAKEKTKYPEVAWLGDNSPEKGNPNKMIYESMQLGRELGITYRLYRASDPVCMPAYFPTFGEDLTEYYWKMIDSTVYTHLDQESSDYLKSTDILDDYLDNLHGIGCDWYLDYYQSGYYYDTNATKTKEYAFSFDMPYDASFARCGAKYTLNLSDTLTDISDDKLTSANMRTLTEIDEGVSITKAKICGFVYLDKNNNNVMDERLSDHFQGAKLTITDSNGNVVYDALTKQNGYYEYETNTTGNYTITITLPNGYQSSTSAIHTTIIDGTYQSSVNNFAITK